MMKITTLPAEILYLILDQLPSPVDKTCFRHAHPYFLSLRLGNTSCDSDSYFLRGDYGLMSPLASRQPLKILCDELFPQVVAEGIAYRAEYILRCFAEKVNNGESEQSISQIMLMWKLKERFVERIEMVRRIDWEGKRGGEEEDGVLVMRLEWDFVMRWNWFKGEIWRASLKVRRLVSKLKRLIFDTVGLYNERECNELQ